MSAACRSVIVFLTNRCPVGCPSCNTAARPDDDRKLTPDFLNRFLPQIAEPPRPLYVIWTGGEPFEAFDSMAAGIRIASERGFNNEILTSGCWFRHRPGLLDELCDAGEFHMRISLDAEHQRTVSMNTIHDLIDALAARRIRTGFTLRRIPERLPEPGQYMAELRQRHPELRAASGETSRLFHVLPTIPAGFPPDRCPSGITADPGPCRLGFRDLVIGPDGRVYPCCGLFGIGIDDQVSAGDALADFPEPASKHLAERPLFRDLRDRGAWALAREHGIIPVELPASGYAGPCHACRVILPVLLQETAEAGPEAAGSRHIPGSIRS